MKQMFLLFIAYKYIETKPYPKTCSSLNNEKPIRWYISIVAKKFNKEKLANIYNKNENSRNMISSIDIQNKTIFN